MRFCELAKQAWRTLFTYGIIYSILSVLLLPKSTKRGINYIEPKERRVVMADAKIRINKISLWNFKNVTHGTIHLNSSNSIVNNKSDIMGIYGQNASGKTAVIEALAIIKDIISGRKINPRFENVITNGKDECTIEVEVSMLYDDYELDCTAIYKCSLSLRNDPNDNNEKPKKIMAVVSESLRARVNMPGEKFIMQDILKTDENQLSLLPKGKRTLLFGTNEDMSNFLAQQKILALYGSRSFIFSHQVSKAISENKKNSNSNNEISANWPKMVITYLRYYATLQLFVIDERTGHNLDFHIIQEGNVLKIPLNVDISLPTSIDTFDEAIKVINDLIPRLNHVLSNITPGLALKVEVEKESLDRNDNKYKVEFLSNREGFGTFPFSNESLGIKKMISFIVLLIEAYNNPSFTLAIDEMDSGIFEYLFGEILDIMGSSGKGQLIFTSHNLRPLERLDPRFVCFTTTDPSNRYIQMNKKATNNLRDMYIRALQLGYDGKDLYNGDSKHSLAYAFRKMGRHSE